MPYLSLYHPLILFLVENLISTATAAFTHKDSLLRYPAFIICVAISWLAISNFHVYIQTTGWSGRIFAGAIVTVPNVLFDRLIVRKWAFGRDYLGPAETSETERKKQSRWEFGSEVSASTRCIGSAKEVANVPFFDQENPQYVPTRSSFLLRHFFLVVGLYYLNVFAIDIQLRSNQELLADVYIPFFSRITQVPVEEIITRIRISIAYWVAQYCFIQLLYSLFALINVSLKPVGLKFWRPQFGSITTSYTVRGFWGKFWHQNIQLNVKGPADFITHTILRIPSATIFARYSKILLAFSVSGAMHVVVDSGGAVPMAQSGALRFFCTQALGIIVEDGVQELYRRVFGNQKSRVGKAIGYLWVLAFLSWSTPVWVYPVARTMKREDMMLTVNALRPLVANLW